MTVAEITTSARGLPAEVDLGNDEVDLDRVSVVNCDGLHTVPRTSLTEHVGAVGPATMSRICDALAYAVGC